MKRFIPLLLLLSFVAGAFADDRMYLRGRIKESVGKTDLLKGYVLLYDSAGAVRDTVRTSGRRYSNGEMKDVSYFGFMVSKKDSTYVFDVECEGYTPQTVTYRVENVGKRETYRTIPTVYLERAPHKLNEVTVTASKIKFYNKGDTVVFNADAFQLAEGSMLDALIAQLPGVELNESGQIKVNGEFVESLLLNGKEFLDGQNNLMLENIAAYTVKNIEVYEGQTPEEKWRNDGNQKRHLTMDVKLKREYNQGWIINAQGGYGTEDRYMGRLFASWFTPTTNITLLGNANNLNDNRQPGKSDTWTPEMMPSGTKQYRMGGVNYNYDSPENDRTARGHLTFEQTVNNNLRTEARTNFLAGGDTYENSFSDGRNRETKLHTQHSLRMMKERYMTGLYLKGSYLRKNSRSASVSGTFDTEQQDMTMKALEAIYSDGSPERLDAIINRSINRSDGWYRTWDGQAFPSISWKIPRSNDHLGYEFGIKYSDRKEERWRDYDINYGSDPVPAYRRRQYFDDTPNHTLTVMNNFTYNFNIKKVYLYLNYEQRFLDRSKDSYMYALDRMADMGVYGTLPGGYLDTFDPANSYTSRLMENTQTLQPSVQYHTYFGAKEDHYLLVLLSPSVAFKHAHLDYWRDGRSFLVKQSDFLIKTSRWDARIGYSFGTIGTGRKSRYRNRFVYTCQVDPKTPDLTDMIDVVNDADPLNIYEGNPDLKVQYKIGNELSWTYDPEQTKINNTLRVSYSTTSNALTRGYTYDTSTGVRHNRMYNVGGNSDYGFSNSLRYQFGSTDWFTLSSNTDVWRYNYGDMIGVDLSAPQLSKVASRNITEKLSLSWQIGKQNLQLKGQYSNRHTTSTREGFNPIDADHYNVGLIGQFKLPWGLGISTDFNLYTRRGYGVKELDTTDAIWNMRLSWCPPRAKRWVFMVDGFDMLHQLSNVNYAVSATGRTVSYTNALPRYVLFSAQYRLNIQPKKR